MASTSSSPEPPKATITVGYRPPFAQPAGLLRPHLWVSVERPNQPPTNVYGLIDTGADITVMPFPWSIVLGLTAADLEKGEDAVQVAGKVATWHPKNPLNATIVGLPNDWFQLQPMFIPGATMVLWGRRDLMAAWNLYLSEGDQAFTLVRR